MEKFSFQQAPNGFLLLLGTSFSILEHIHSQQHLICRQWSDVFYSPSSLKEIQRGERRRKGEKKNQSTFLFPASNPQSRSLREEHSSGNRKKAFSFAADATLSAKKMDHILPFSPYNVMWQAVIRLLLFAPLNPRRLGILALSTA